MSSIGNISSSYLQSILSNALRGTGLTTNPTGNSLSGIGTSSIALQPDSQQLSPFAQLMSTLQQLQQTDPTKYSQVTQQIATNLQSAAQTAQSDGNTSAANQLAADFSNASKSGQLPNIQDLAQAVGGHRHHHHGHKASADADSNSSSSNSSIGTSSSSSTNQTLSQFLSALHANGPQNDALNPATIILKTLSNAGSSVGNS